MSADSLDVVHGGLDWQQFRQSDNVLDMRGVPLQSDLPRGWARTMQNDFNDYLARGDFDSMYQPMSPAARDIADRISSYQNAHAKPMGPYIDETEHGFGLELELE